ncbi:MAG TPA: sigma-70 family RNA polymerase sigma factor, partial [Ignavibacteria bacterium]|nr:sigma-70 family RNA polymerase sigma factor [Ignavibacteria bacterium]
MNINSDDELLIAAFKAGSQNAFNLIVRKYQKRIYMLIRKMVIDHDDADDITQEVFIKLYSSLNSFRGDSKFFTYLYKIAVNYSINHLNRKNKLAKRNSEFDETNEFHSFDSINDFSENADEKNRSEILKEAIETLPEQQRAVFIMRYYDNLSYEEISKILEKSVGGMKANYFHALKKIGTCLKKNKL